MNADPLPPQKLRALRSSNMPVLRQGTGCQTVKVEAGASSWLSLTAKYNLASVNELIRANPDIAGKPKAGDVIFLPPCLNGSK